MERGGGGGEQPGSVLEDDVLEDRLERIDGQLRLEPAAQRMLELVALDFAEEVVSGAARLAKHRGDGQVGVNDVASHLLMQWGMRVPAFRSDTRDRVVEASRDATVPAAHRARLDIKASLQQASEDAK